MQLYWPASPDRVQECLMAGKDPEVIHHIITHTDTCKFTRLHKKSNITVCYHELGYFIACCSVVLPHNKLSKEFNNKPRQLHDRIYNQTKAE